MKLIFRFNMLMAVLVLTACMQSTGGINSSDTPQWVRGEPDMYPNSEYLSATGSASRAEQAKARALSNLAKIFEVRIREVSTTTQDVQTNKVEGVETVQVKQRIASSVNLHTDKMIQGARIAEQWQSGADLTYHALAVLDRSQAGNNIRSEMRRLDEETQFSLDQLAKRDTILLKISDLKKANELQQDRQTLQKTLKIIDVKGRGAPANWNLADLREQLQQELRALPLSATVKSDDVGGLENMLQGAASRAGFTVTDAGGQQKTYRLSASLEAQPVIKKDDWYWQRATLSVELVSLDGISVIGYQSWSLKVNAGDASQLSSRIRKAVQDKLDQELLDTIFGFTG